MPMRFPSARLRAWRPFVLAFGFCFGVGVICGTAARGQPPTVNRLEPAAVAPGETADVAIHGSDLASPVALWTTFNAGAAFPSSTPQQPDRVTCRLTAPPDAQVGVHALRLATRSGVSELRLFMVDDLPSAAEAAGNSSRGAAQAIAVPVAVDGACDAGESDYYRFPARKGQRLAFEVVAARLGTRLDPALRLLDSTGRELAWHDDTPGAGSDCRFAHTFASDGEYVVELRDAGYEGGPQHRYRLRVGDFPIATAPFPLGGKRGSSATFGFVGPDCAGVKPLTLTMPLTLPSVRRSVPLGVACAGPDGPSRGSGFVAAAAGEWDESVESEPNDAPDSATALAIPSAFSGRLEPARDRDWFQLAAKKGQRLTFAARTRSLGSPCDVVLRLYRPDGSGLAESKVEGASEGTLDATIPDDGIYRLSVEDINRAGGPGLAYRVEVAPRRPGFALSVEADKVEARPGGSFELKVTCARRDYNGPITLRLSGIDGVATETATIAGGKNETTLKVKLPADFKADGIIHFQVVGAAKVGDVEFTAAASTMPALRRQFPNLLHPPELTDGLIAFVLLSR